MDVYETCCGVCLELLACWPYSDDPATSNLALTRLPCRHSFHTECICARSVHLQLDQRTRQVEAVSFPLVAGLCPLCRCPWSQAETEQHILGDFDSGDEEKESGDEENESDEDEAPNDGGTVLDDDALQSPVVPSQPAAASMQWTRYMDPAAGEIFWSTEEEEDYFLESSDSWVRFLTPSGQLWWSKVVDEASWFYASTGTQRAAA